MTEEELDKLAPDRREGIAAAFWYLCTKSRYHNRGGSMALAKDYLESLEINERRCDK